MNCPSKTEPIVPDHFNQTPNGLAADLTTNNDLARIAALRLQYNHRLKDQHVLHIEPAAVQEPCGYILRRRGGGDEGDEGFVMKREAEESTIKREANIGEQMLQDTIGTAIGGSSSFDNQDPRAPFWKRSFTSTGRVLKRYARFVGPGFMISVAYIDPGNYATDVAGGATYRFKLLFMVLLSNIIAIFLQALCIKLGTVSGLNLAEMCKAQFPRWLNYTLYVFAEAAIIATDIAEVIGTAIALNLLCNKIPLVAGCAISIFDVLVILIFWRPDGKMKMLRVFELGVTLLVLGVTVCFCFQLSLIRGVAVGDVFKGYLPSSALVEGQG